MKANEAYYAAISGMLSRIMETQGEAMEKAASAVADQIAEGGRILTQNPTVVLLLINVFLLIVGCFLEGCSAILLLTPILLPVVQALGVHPVQFGLIMVLNLMIGLITPPFGLVLFVTSRVAKLQLGKLIKATMPFLVPLIVTLLLITLIPDLVMWLPTLAGMIR